MARKVSGGGMSGGGFHYFDEPDPFKEAELDEEERLFDMLDPEERAEVEEERGERARRRIANRKRQGGNA